MADSTPYKVPKEPGRWRAIMLAAVVHAALLALLWVGVRWQNETPIAVEAEVWSPQAREAAPKPQPEPEPEPEKKPEPKSEPKPVVKEIVKPKIVEPPVPKPDIALEQEKKRKEQEQKRKERQEDERLAKLEQKKEQDLEEKRRLKADAAQVEKEKADAAKKKLAVEEWKKKVALEKKRKEDAADAQALAKLRDDEMKRISGGVTGSGGSGDAPKSQGGRADSGYISRVAAKIKSNTIFNVTEDLADNPPVEYAVELLPDGSLRGIRKLKPSGVPGFDEAVRRAIEKSQPYPPDKSGIAPSGFTLSHKPKDQ